MMFKRDFGGEVDVEFLYSPETGEVVDVLNASYIGPGEAAAVELTGSERARAVREFLASIKCSFRPRSKGGR